MFNVPPHLSSLEHAPQPETLRLTELQANYLLASLTAEERKGIEEERTLEGVRLTLPPSFHWVTVPPSPAPSLLKRGHLATVPNGAPRIQVVCDASDTIVEVTVLKP